MAVLLSTEELQVVLDRLVADGRTVLAPVRRDGTIAVDEVTRVDELPIGWREEQAPGRSRLEPTDRPDRFTTTAPTPGWKRYLYPERTLLVRARRTAPDQLEVEQPTEPPARLAFFGIRSCDVHAIDRLDRVFLAPGATDPAYAARRTDVLVVAVTCADPGATCFCASMETGPVPTVGFDVRLTELVDHPTGHRVLADSGTDRGAALLDGLGTPSAPSDHDRAAAVGEASRARMGRTLDPADVARAGTVPDHPRWDDVATRCLSCTSCTMVCPTCFCSTTEEHSDLDGTDLERWRRWDSCFSLDFSWMHGGEVRPSIRSRYRQWLLHKLVTWHDQFDVSGCVGCGRCITWCPVGIDLTAEIAALAQPAPAARPVGAATTPPTGSPP